MERTVLCLWVVLAVLCSVVHPHSHDHGHGDHHEHHVNSSLRLYRENQKFAFRLYKHIAAQSDSQSKNVFFSPLSVSIALAAVCLGAGGQTHQQLFSGLGFNDSDITKEEVHQAFQSILQELNQKTGVDLKVGSALFMSETFKPHPEFLENLKRFYLSDGYTADFTKTTETTDMINNYVKEKTHGKIDNLVENLDPATVMYLLSYIYFKGKWQIPFDPKDTKEDTFHVDATTTVPVQMMKKKDDYNVYYDHEASTSVLQLHYNESVSMMLALPEKGLASLEEVVCPEHVAKWHRWTRKRKYTVYVPKLSIATKYSLKDVLKGMGMPDMFSARADFSGISEDPLLVSEVVHQATLDVDEAGATATAVTGVSIMPMSFQRPAVLKFDRPFMVIICNHDTKSILFMGKIVNPAEK